MQSCWPESLTTLREFADPEGTHWRRRGGKAQLPSKTLRKYLEDDTTTVVLECDGEPTRVLTAGERMAISARLAQPKRPDWESIDGFEYRNAAHARLVVVAEDH